MYSQLKSTMCAVEVEQEVLEDAMDIAMMEFGAFFCVYECVCLYAVCVLHALARLLSHAHMLCSYVLDGQGASRVGGRQKGGRHTKRPPAMPVAMQEPPPHCLPHAHMLTPGLCHLLPGLQARA